MSLFSSLRREQREAIGLLQIGTFLEYFDLMLYVHMAVLLNDLFFPKTDPHTATLLSAFTFCSVFVFRPFGALLFGYLGDHIGRKATVVITTMMMAASCIVIANLPTYAQIGMTAAWIMIFCRVLQGLSSMGEVIGAQIYITEIIKPPAQYPAMGFLVCANVFGSLMALAVASLATTSGLNWRLAFWVGTGIALVGSVARTRLRETPDFVDMKRRMKKAIEESSRDGLEKASALLKSTNILFKEKSNPKSAVALFLIQSGWPVSFYFTYMYCGNILKTNFQYTPGEVIKHNFFVAIIELISAILFTILSYKIFPLKLLKFRALVVSPFILLCPYLLTHISSPFYLFLIQSFFIFFAFSSNPAYSIFYIHFPIFKRFTWICSLFAMSYALMYIITSFGLVYLTELFGHYGVLIIMTPVVFGFLWGIHHFENLEREAQHDNPETAFRRQTA